MDVEDYLASCVLQFSIMATLCILALHSTTKKSDKGDGAKSPQDKKAQPEQPRLPPPKPPHLEDLSSSDTQNSDIDSLYGSLRRNQARGIQGQMSESDGEITPQGTARRPPPRRHTVGGAQIQQHLMQGDGTDRKKEAFFELLAQRYPQYADKITGMALYQTNTPAERVREQPRRQVHVEQNHLNHTRPLRRLSLTVPQGLFAGSSDRCLTIWPRAPGARESKSAADNEDNSSSLRDRKNVRRSRPQRESAVRLAVIDGQRTVCDGLDLVTIWSQLSGRLGHG
ncbi:hypothetical protein BaRGS_00010330 [Batillaria attramentaria]|uniref:Uncharacterized protein n=1 Tax=Batillaria attramentaria TaxID=370345 RepID=A0ABD0LGN9_9CAEN